MKSHFQQRFHVVAAIVCTSGIIKKLLQPDIMLRPERSSPEPERIKSLLSCFTRFIPSTAFEYLSSMTPAAAADLHLTPATLAVLRGDVAEFTCSTANTDWTVMILSLNGKSILTIYNQTGLLPSPTNNHVTAKELVPGSPRKGWVFFLNTTHMSDETKVTCLLQGIAEESATLSVQGWCARCGRFGVQDEKPTRSTASLSCHFSQSQIRAIIQFQLTCSCVNKNVLPNRKARLDVRTCLYTKRRKTPTNYVSMSAASMDVAFWLNTFSPLGKMTEFSAAGSAEIDPNILCLSKY